MSNYDIVCGILEDKEVALGDHLEDALVALKESEEWMMALLYAGVDNWEGYDYAMELLNE